MNIEQLEHVFGIVRLFREQLEMAPQGLNVGCDNYENFLDCKEYIDLIKLDIDNILLNIARIYRIRIPRHILSINDLK